MENSLQRHNKNDNRALNGAHENLLNYKNKGIIILKGKNKRVKKMCKKMRKTNNTMTEIRAIDYCKKVDGTGRYYSFCPNCGWRGDCDDLLFDVSEVIISVIISYVTEAPKGFLSEEKQKIFERRVVGEIKILKSTKQLRSYTEKGFELQGLADDENTEAHEIYKKIEEIVEAPEAGFTRDEKESLAKKIKEIINSRFGKVELIPSPDNDAVTGSVSIGGKQLSSSERYCPECKENGQVSRYSGCYPEIVMALLGGPRVSKTTTLCAAIHALKRDHERVRDITVSFDNNKKLTDKWPVTKEDDEKSPLYMYRTNQKVGSTKTIAETGIACSFLVKIGRAGVLISAIDIAGELFRTLSTRENKNDKENEILNTYITKYKFVDYLWICIDASTLIHETAQANEQDEQVKKALGYEDDKADKDDKDDKDSPTEVEFTGIDAIINSFKEVVIRRSSDYKLKGVALIWGKIDVYPKEDRMGVVTQKPSKVLADWKRYTERYSNNYDNGYGVIKRGSVLDAAVIKGQSSHIKEKLIHFIGNSLFTEVSHGAGGRACVFATSNYGHKPGECGIIQPFNTMLPLLWMIAMEGRMMVEINREDEPGWFVGLLDRLGLNSGRNTEKTTLSSEADKKHYLCNI